MNLVQKRGQMNNSSYYNPTRILFGEGVIVSLLENLLEINPIICPLKKYKEPKTNSIKKETKTYQNISFFGQHPYWYQL